MNLPTTILGFILFFLPFFILGENAYVMVHDNLENEFAYILHIIRSGHWLHFSQDIEFPNIMEGVSRNAFRSGLNYTFLLFSLLPPYWAYVVNKIIAHLIGGLGMFLLLKRHILPHKEQEGMVLLFSLAFSIVPYATIFCGISISGQPLLLFAFLNVAKEKWRWYDVLIIILFPFWISSLLVAPFVVLFYLLLFCYIRKKNKSPYMYLFLLGTLALLCLAIEFPLLSHTLFNKSFTSHRIEIDRFNEPFLNDIGTFIPSQNSFYRFLKSLFHGKWHSGNFLNLPIWILAFWTLWSVPKSRKRVALCLFVIIGISMYGALLPHIYRISPSLNSFLNLYSAERLYFLQPMLFFVLGATSVYFLLSFRKATPVAMYSILVCQLALVLVANLYPKKNVELRNNICLLLGNKIDEPTFRQFFDVDLYRRVKQHIGKVPSSYRIVNLSLPTSAAQYNGFFTLDSYQNNYSLDYKKKFRKVIARELEKSPALAFYYDYNGSRCYAFSSETRGRLIGKDETNSEVCQLDWNLSLLESMNCKYILSAVPIVRHPRLKLEKVFEDKNSFWKIYLYAM